MVTRPGTVEDLERLRQEREEAERAYNDALTALDRAIERFGSLPQPPPPYDDSQLAAINSRWELLSAKPDEGSGWLRRIRAHAWAMAAPLFERQQTFNAAIVDHLNRNVAAHQETTRAIVETLAAVRAELDRMAYFQNKLILYAQQITPFVDTKDRYVAGLPSGLAAAISALSDELHKRWESMAARELRYESQVTDVRATLSVVQRAVQTIRRELETRQASPRSPAAAPPVASAVQAARPLDSYKYVAFEDRFRGSRQEIRERVADYLPIFDGASDVLEVGCGRGEFLDLLREHGISARGIDLNDEMAALCRDRGLDVTTADALSYLLAQPDGSLGGLFAAQVVEHLEPDYLMRVLDGAYHKLRPGSKIVLETINPACWYAFFSSYIRDLTHARPLHPETLQYLLVASGFQRVELRYLAPVPEESKLQPVPAVTTDASGAVAPAISPAVADVVNENVKRLNSLLFTYLDYAAIGERL